MGTPSFGRSLPGATPELLIPAQLGAGAGPAASTVTGTPFIALSPTVYHLASSSRGCLTPGVLAWFRLIVEVLVEAIRAEALSARGGVSAWWQARGQRVSSLVQIRWDRAARQQRRRCRSWR